MSGLVVACEAATDETAVGTEDIGDDRLEIIGVTLGADAIGILAEVLVDNMRQSSQNLGKIHCIFGHLLILMMILTIRLHVGKLCEY